MDSAERLLESVVIPIIDNSREPRDVAGSLVDHFRKRYEECSCDTDANRPAIELVFRTVKCLGVDSMKQFIKALLKAHNWKVSVVLKYNQASWSEEEVFNALNLYKCTLDSDFITFYFNISDEVQKLLVKQTFSRMPAREISMMTEQEINNELDKLQSYSTERDVRVDLRTSKKRRIETKDTFAPSNNRKQDLILAHEFYSLYEDEYVKKKKTGPDSALYKAWCKAKAEHKWLSKAPHDWIRHLDNHGHNIILIGPLFPRIKERLFEELIDASIFDAKDYGIELFPEALEEEINTKPACIAVLNIDYFPQLKMEKSLLTLRKKYKGKLVVHSNTGLYAGLFSNIKNSKVHRMSSCCLKYVSENEQVTEEDESILNEFGGHFTEELLESNFNEQVSNMHFIFDSRYKNDWEYIVCILRKFRRLIEDGAVYFMLLQLVTYKHYNVYTVFAEPAFDLDSSRFLIRKVEEGDNFNDKKHKFFLRILNNLLLLNSGLEKVNANDAPYVGYSFVNQKAVRILSLILWECQSSFPVPIKDILLHLQETILHLFTENDKDKKKLFKKFIYEMNAFFETLPMKREELTENTVNSHFASFFNRPGLFVKVDSALYYSTSKPDMYGGNESRTIVEVGETKRNKTLPLTIENYLQKRLFDGFRDTDTQIALCCNYYNNYNDFEITSVYKSSTHFIFASITKDNKLIHFIDLWP